MNKPKTQPWPSVIPTTQIEPPIPETYHSIDTDIARDNLENDLPEADRQDVYRAPHPKLNLQFNPSEKNR